MRKALEEPLKQIAVNAGLEGGVVVEKVRGLRKKGGANGLNAATGEYVDMFKAGIVDPAKVTRSALQNAASIAALFLTTEAIVADKPEKAPAMPAMPGGGMDDSRLVRDHSKAPARRGPFASRLGSRRHGRRRRSRACVSALEGSTGG